MWPYTSLDFSPLSLVTWNGEVGRSGKQINENFDLFLLLLWPAFCGLDLVRRLVDFRSKVEIL